MNIFKKLLKTKKIDTVTATNRVNNIQTELKNKGIILNSNEINDLFKAVIISPFGSSDRILIKALVSKYRNIEIGPH